MARNILVVEDDNNISDLIRMYLEKEGFEVRIAADGGKAVEEFKAREPDLVLLDVMLPVLDGWGVCAKIRETSKCPIIMLTAKGEVNDRIHGLEMGADDYLVKPFSMRELAARMKAILRRTQQKPGSTQEDSLLRCQDLVLDVRRHAAFIGESELSLTPIEFSLLELFLRHPEQVFNRLQLLEATHGFAFEGYERTIDAHIRNLRRKMETAAPGTKYIKTVYGIGYRLGGTGHV